MNAMQTLYCGIVPIMALAGIYALTRGKILLSRQMFLTGVNARIVGLILLLPMFGVISAVCYESLILSQPMVRMFSHGLASGLEKAYEQTSYLPVVSLLAAFAWIFTFRRQVRVTSPT